MSKYVSELIEDIHNNPNSWKNNEGQGICKENITIGPMTPLLFLVIADVKIDDHEQPLTYIDRLRLEIALRRWFRTVPLSKITKS